jgi:hypothetical protein
MRSSHRIDVSQLRQISLDGKSESREGESKQEEHLGKHPFGDNKERDDVSFFLLTALALLPPDIRSIALTSSKYFRMFSRVRKSMRAACRLIRGTPMWTRHSCGNHGPKNLSCMSVSHFISDVVFVCHVDDARNLSVEHVVRRHNLEKR